MAWDPLTEFLLGSTRRRVFVSYHHKDEVYRQEWDRLFGSFTSNVSVGPGEINDENSAEYIKRVIQKDYISHASVVVVLIGPRTYCRKHVDWEISAGLNRKVNGYSGLMGILLPNHPDYLKTTYRRELVPARLVDNIESGYAPLYDWSPDTVRVRGWIEDAFRRRVSAAAKIVNSRVQLGRNLCD